MYFRRRLVYNKTEIYDDITHPNKILNSTFGEI